MTKQSTAPKTFTRVKLTPKKQISTATPEDRRVVATAARKVIIEHYPVIKALAKRRDGIGRFGMAKLYDPESAQSF